MQPFDEDIQSYRELSQSNAVKESKVRSAMSFLQARMAYFFADSYIQYKGEYYTCADDVGKEQGQTKSPVIKADMVFPLCYAYGSVDTYSFSILNDYLSARSIKSSDFYDPMDHYVPYEDDDSFDKYMKSIICKKTSVPSKSVGGYSSSSYDADSSDGADGDVGPGEF